MPCGNINKGKKRLSFCHAQQMAGVHSTGQHADHNPSDWLSTVLMLPADFREFNQPGGCHLCAFSVADEQIITAIPELLRVQKYKVGIGCDSLSLVA